MANSWLLAHEDFVAVEVFKLYPRAPRSRLRLAEKLHAQRLHALVVANAVRRIEPQESVAAALLAHYRLVVGRLSQLQRDCNVAVLRQRNRDPAAFSEGLVLVELKAKFPRVELDGGVLVEDQHCDDLYLVH